MGKYVNSNKVTLTKGYEYDDAIAEIAQLLGVSKRSDGRYHISDICQSSYINANARYKPEDYNTLTNLSTTDRAANNYGFGSTVPYFKAGYSEVPHAVYEYKRPKGTDTSRNRLLDFNGYFHKAASPLSLIFPAELYYDGGNIVSIRANDDGVTNYNPTDCIKLGDVMHANNDLYVALYIHYSSDKQWLLPTNVKVKDLSSSTFPQIVFSPNSSQLPTQSGNVYPYYLPDIANRDGQSYTLVAVGVNALTYQTDKTPLAVGSSKPIGDRWLYSMELTNGADRRVVPISTLKKLDGLTATFTATMVLQSATAPSGFSQYPAYQLKSASSTLKVTTPSNWGFNSQDKVYIKATIQCSGYTFTNAGVQTSWESVLAATLDKANTTFTITSLLDMWGNYKFVDIANLSGYMPFTIIITAYKDQTYKDGKRLYSGTINATKV